MEIKQYKKLILSETSDAYYGWSCPIKKITKCNVSPRLIESQFTVSTRRTFATKRTESPLYHLTSKPNNFAKFESKRDHANATLCQTPVPKQGDDKQDLDKNIVTTQTSISKIKNTTTRKIRSPSPKKSKCRLRNLKTVASGKFRSLTPRTSKCKIHKLGRKVNRCANRSIQTERQCVLSHFTSMVNGIGTAVVDKAPWIPYISATALTIVLFGYCLKRVEKVLCRYITANELLSKFHFDIPLMNDERDDDVQKSPIPEPPSTHGATVDPHTLRIYHSELNDSDSSSDGETEDEVEAESMSEYL